MLRKILFLFLFLSLFSFPHVINADTTGQRVNFNVNSHFDKFGRTTLNATLRQINDRAYFYVDDDYWNRLSLSARDSLITNIQILAGDFDNNIHPKETAFWGSEPSPGIDNDIRITLVLEELVNNNGGYFETGNGYTRAQIPESNEREVIFLNVGIMTTDIFVTKMFLAHEFQHLISFQQKEKTYGIPEETWLNELRSEYSISLVGHNDIYDKSNLDRRSYTFSNSQSDSLTEWPNNNTDYATVTLFAEYIVEQFGRNILSESLKGPFTGITSINKYFEGNGYTERFGDVFLSWMGALYLNDNSQNPKLGYARPELKTLRATPQQRMYMPLGSTESSLAQSLKDWQPVWLEFDVSAISGDFTKSARIDLSGEPGQNFIASYIALYESGSSEYRKIDMVGGKGSGFVLNLPNKKLKKIVILATKATKISNFGTSEPLSLLNFKVSMVEAGEVQAGILKDGSLIKRPREKEIYVVWGKYKRYLNPQVITLYGHLDPSKAIELEPALFDSYITSNYVKYVGDEKVYAVWPDGTKHWLHITPGQWDASGRDWGAIFTINEHEVNYYKIGPDITR